jgi:dihydrofolate reductase
MGKLIYIAVASLDGFMSDLSDPDVDPTWGVPNAAFYSSILDVHRTVGTYLYGRRMYETMSVWESAHVDPSAPAFTPGLKDHEREFATLWRAADKVVFSTTLAEVSLKRTRIERVVDPDEIRRFKATSEQNITVGGPHLAAAVIAANLVDEFHVYVHPVILGKGIAWLPRDRHLRLELADERRLGGIVHLHYKAVS